MPNYLSKQDKIELVKKYFGWDDEFIKKLSPSYLYAAFRIMTLEKEEHNGNPTKYKV